MASTNVSFDTLPSSIRKPGKYLEFNTSLAVRTLSSNEQEVLIMGTMSSSGTQEALVPVQVFSDQEAATYFGYGSIAHMMAAAAIKANPYIYLTVIGITEATAGIAATGKLTISGTATSSGVLSLYIGTEAVQVAIAKGDTAAESASALVSAFAAYPSLPVTAAAASGVITLTAKNKGALGNNIGLSAQSTASSLTVAVTAMASGDVDPDPADALAAVYNAGHDIIITPYSSQDDLTTLRDHLDGVSHALEQRGAIGIYALTSTLSQASTLAALINSGRITGALLPATTSFPWEVAAAYGAVMASEEDPARPLNTLDLTGIAVPDVEYRLGRMEQETALANGVTPLEVGSGDTVQIVRAISTYTLNAEGVTDVSLLDITTIRSLDYVRKVIRERIALRFPREKLSSRTADKVRSEIIDVLKKLEALEIVEEVDANLDGLIVERDEQDVNRLNAKIPTDVVNGLHVFAGRIDLLL